MFKYMVKPLLVLMLVGGLAACDKKTDEKPGAAAKPAAQKLAEGDIALVNGKVIFHLPDGFKNSLPNVQVKAKDADEMKEGLFENSKTHQMITTSELGVSMMVNAPPNNSSESLKILSHAVLTGLSHQYDNLKMTSETDVMLNNYRFHRLNTAQTINKKASVATTFVSVLDKHAIILHIVTEADGKGNTDAHQALVQGISDSVKVAQSSGTEVKADTKPTDVKKPDDKKADTKTADVKQADEKKADTKPTDVKKSDDKKADTKTADVKKSDEKK